MSTHDMEIVSKIRLAIAQSVGSERFELWFAGTEFEFVNDTLHVRSAKRFNMEWLRKNQRGAISAACASVLGAEPKVEFSVDSQLAEQAEMAAENEPVHEQHKDARASAITTQRRKFLTLDSYVVGANNRLAFTAAEMVAREPGEVTPLFIYGPTAVGKTHLLEGIWSAIRRRPERRRCLYLTAEQFTSFFLEALHGRGLPSFRRRYREADLLVIEDVQFLMGKQATVTEFQFTVDTLIRDGRQLVFSSDRAPAELGRLGPEITTRLGGGLVAAIKPPDQSTRVGIVQRFARERQLIIGYDVCEMIAEHFSEDVRQLSGAVNRLRAATLAIGGAAVTMDIALETLDELVRSSNRAVHLADIERVVCDVFGVESRKLRSDSRVRQLTYPRMLAMWLARKHTRSVLSEIGEYFGKRSHSTVISAEKKVNDWVADDLQVHLPDCDCSVQEAIRRIESKLRAG